MSWQPPADAGRTLIPGLEGYTELQLIAHGSTAMVFRGVQSRLNRTVAIKVLLVDDVMTTQANVARELETTVALSSQPHIVSIIDTGVTEDGSPFIVMEYCDGGSYAQILKRHGPLPLGEVLEVGIKIGEALHAAHGVGIVHRDVKPPNILRSRFGPALADFGIARAADDGGDATSTLDKLTPHHASPEALLRGAQSGSSDLYSLASTMWNLLAGRPPFHDTALTRQDPLAFRARVLTQPMPRVPREDVPEWLQQELARAMAKDPTDRHESAGAFAETLRSGGHASSPWAPQSAAATGAPAPAAPAPGEPAPIAGEPAPDAEALTQWVRAPAAVNRAPAPPAPWQAAPKPEPSRPKDQDQASADEPAEAPSRAKAIAVMSGIGVLFGVLIVAAATMFGGKPDTRGPTAGDQRTTPPAPVQSVVGKVDKAPHGLAVEDFGASVKLSWDNGSSASVSKLILGYRTTPDAKSAPLGVADPGQTSIVLNGLNKNVEYCFTVTAVYASNDVARSAPVCTKRTAGGTATASPATR